VYRGRREPFRNLEELKERVEEVWPLVPEKKIRAAILQWRARVQGVIDEKGDPLCTDSNK
jgi:hypothetical protein